MIIKGNLAEKSGSIGVSLSEPLVLGGELALHLVESGTVALYAAEIREGIQVGPRYLLQRMGRGQAMLSVPCETSSNFGFLVVPIGKASTSELPFEEAVSSSVDTSIEAWLGLLADILGQRKLPKLCNRVSEPTETTLEPGEALGTGRTEFIWVEVLEGSARFSDLEGLLIDPTTGPIPLTELTWIRAEGGARVRVHTQASLTDQAAIVRGFSTLHSMVLGHVAARMQEQQREELERLRLRGPDEERRTQNALEDLASVFDRSKAPIHADTPLLAAITAIGQVLGVKVRPPGRAEATGRSDPIDAIARASRIRLRRVALVDDWWIRDCGPLLGFLEGAEGKSRPVALLFTRAMNYELFDPEDGSRSPLDRELASSLTPEGVSFYRPLPEEHISLFGLLRFSMAPRLRALLIAVLTGIVATLLGMITPQATALIMDNAIPDSDSRLLLELGAGLLATAFGVLIFQLAQGLALTRIGIGSEAEGQAAVWDRLLRLHPTFFRDYSTGDLQSRVNGVTQIGQQMTGATLTAVFAGFMAILNLGLLCYYSPKLSLVAVGIGLVLMIFTVAMGFLLRRNLRVLLELGGEFFGLVIQLISAVGKLRVAGAEGRASTHWIKQYTRQLRLHDKVQRLNDVSTAFNMLLTPVSTILLYLLAYDMLLESRLPGGDGGISLGIFLAFSAAFGTFLSGISSLSSTVVGFQNLVMQGKRIRPILDAIPEADDSKSDPGRLEGRLEVQDATFGYDEETRVLDGVSIRAEPGEFVAIVGPSGSGKSTLLRLVLGFETPGEGMVSYDGRDLRSLDVVGVRRQLGVVLQGGSIESASLFDIIASGNIITLNEAWVAAESAGLAEDIRQMPMGMHTVIGAGGGSLSGGQRQRLLIARALANDPRILLFDEATSALDNRTQAIVSESLERLKTTRVVIAHRMSTIRHADRIYVVDGGRIVQEGSFDQLMGDEEGLFASMMARQLA
jgi:NHLM bacteriocin system ABC transporter ATP-binding protein